MTPEIPTDPITALTFLVTAVVVPLLVIILAKTSLTGDGKRAVVLTVSTLIGVIHAILAGALAAPDATPTTLVGWLTLIIMTAVVVIMYSQTWYLLLKGKLDAQADAEPPAGTVSPAPSIEGIR